MKLHVAVATILLAAAGSLSSARAQPACGPEALGVSRIVEIDTTGGPLYGLQQYKDHDFLAPGEVVLTFDDGPLRAYTGPVLKALDAHCTKATFFMVGRMAVADPDMAREVVRRGHTAGTHTWSHQYQLGRSSIVKAREEFELGLSAVQRALGTPVAPFFRFPFLSDSRAAIAHLRSRNIASFSIDVDSLDYRQKGPNGATEVVRKVMRDLSHQGKGILLFHDIQRSTAHAMPELLAQLKARGFRIVHIVPKGRAQTLAEFDAVVDRVADRRKLAAAANPLASRTLTWQMGTNIRPGDEPSAVSSYPPPKALPWQQQRQAPPPGWGAAPSAGTTPPTPAAVAPPPEPRRPTLRGTTDEDDWRTRVFN